MNPLRASLVLAFLWGCGGSQHAAVDDSPNLAPPDRTIKGGPPAADSPTTNPPTTTTPSTTTPGTPEPTPDGMTASDGGAARVSFAAQIVPIFSRRVCFQCHSGNGPGKDLGNLTLDGSNNLIYREVVLEKSPNYGTTRVDLQHPEASLILTMPDPTPDKHPVTVFMSTADPDYQLLLDWIRQGAKQN